MDSYFHKSTEVSLVSGSLLIIATMVLHPSGGSLEHIVEDSVMITTAHALAIFSLPLVLFGFYGLTNRLMDSLRISQLAFFIMLFGLIAAMFAAVFNGLALPYFLGQYAGNIEEQRSVLGPIATFSFSINKPLDYIFIAGCCLSILIYSLLIIRQSKFPKWIGFLGISIILFAIIGAVTGFVFTSLTGFRIFTFSLAAWILATGISLTKSQEHTHE